VRELPHLFSAKQTVHDCANQVSVTIVGLFKGLAQAIEDVNLGLK
jgi:hypothetical protein